MPCLLDHESADLLVFRLTYDQPECKSQQEQPDPHLHQKSAPQLSSEAEILATTRWFDVVEMK